MVSGFTGLMVSAPSSHARRDRRAPERLRARHAQLRLLVEQPDLVQLVEALADLGEQRAAGDRHDDVVGRLPAELLGGLERERLRALGVVRAHVDVHERPRVRARELRAQPVDVVVVAVDGDDVAAVHRGRDDLALLEVGGDEHEAAQPRVRGVRGDRVGEVAGRRAGRDLEAELERLRQRDRRDAVLERVRGVHGVVLDPHLAEAELGREAVGAHERREPGAEVDRGVAVGRQQVGVAPDRQRPGGDLLAARVRRGSRRSRRRPRAGRSTTRR